VGLAVEGGELDLGGDLGVGNRDVELERELIAAEVVVLAVGGGGWLGQGCRRHLGWLLICY
jgi:hypothetical protein